MLERFGRFEFDPQASHDDGGSIWSENAGALPCICHSRSQRVYCRVGRRGRPGRRMGGLRRIADMLKLGVTQVLSSLADQRFRRPGRRPAIADGADSGVTRQISCSQSVVENEGSFTATM